MKDMEIAMKVVKHTRSNGIVFVKDGMTIAIGPGQTNRIWAVENGIMQGDEKGDLMLRKTATREQIVVMLHRLYKLLKGE
jgi:AICAR transformylase/IMP cyclohydrolase PurH